MLKITNSIVLGLAESFRASGYPMISNDLDLNTESAKNSTNRAIKLGNVPHGSGHDNFLKGIIVQFDVKYSQYWSLQFQRYNFIDIVSSQSKMHRLTKMDTKESCNKYVDDIVIENMDKWIKIYNSFTEDFALITREKDLFLEYRPEKTVTELHYSLDKYEVFMKIISNTPMGLELTMRVSTNYLQLKTIYAQRKSHKLREDWGVFCDFIEGLPYFKEICLKEAQKC